ncbi:MAG: sigma-70 family RNA polymerase sigma factor [Acidobacteriota bacterium]|jgi:RNA polymerase sigma factor (sigma-70 family)|nr:sigma-70 family RNA polymerase sigma factor [Bryobacteraceae bacterium CoA2 C42]MCA2964118.1 sigma-70 family RNA polymerase sigma factor [Acidobacteriaceae bacterium]
MLDTEQSMTGSRDELFARIRRRVFGFLRRRHGESEAEDMTQRAILVVLERYPEVQREPDLVPLAIRCAQFVQLEEVRKRRRTVQPPEEGFEIASGERPAEEKLLLEARLEQLYSAIPKLGERCRQILRQRLLEVPTPAIAESLQTTTATLFVWESRCRGNLQKLINREAY